MKLINDKTYCLAIKRGNNDYMPLEWNLLPSYNGEDLSTLIGIDNFTRKTTEVDLVNEILEQNLADENDKYTKLVIIFYEKDRIREVSEGVCFLNSSFYITYRNIIDILFSKFNDKVFLNVIVNFLNKKGDYKELREFIYVLNNSQIFIDKGNNGVRAALEIMSGLHYDTMRSLGMYLYEREMLTVSKEHKLTKKDKKAQ